MTTLRNVLHDLVEKRLWPVAAALVVALVALPLAFRGGDDAPAPAPRAAAPIAGTAAAEPATQVSLEADPAVDKRTRKGEIRDPFEQLVEEAAAETAGDTTASAPATTAPSTGVTPSTGGSTSVGSSPSTPSPSGDSGSATTKAPSADAVQRVDVQALRDRFARTARFPVVLRFGERGEELRRLEEPRLLTAMPSAKQPLVVISELRKDGKAVRFLVNALARVTTGGKCSPSREACRTLDLREGSSAIVAVAASPTKVVQYRLQVARIGERD